MTVDGHSSGIKVGKTMLNENRRLEVSSIIVLIKDCLMIILISLFIGMNVIEHLLQTIADEDLREQGTS